jgi:hypothetical protein
MSSVKDFDAVDLVTSQLSLPKLRPAVGNHFKENADLALSRRSLFPNTTARLVLDAFLEYCLPILGRALDCHPPSLKVAFPGEKGLNIGLFGW